MKHQKHLELGPPCLAASRTPFPLATGALLLSAEAGGREFCESWWRLTLMALRSEDLVSAQLCSQAALWPWAGLFTPSDPNSLSIFQPCTLWFRLCTSQATKGQGCWQEKKRSLLTPLAPTDYSWISAPNPSKLLRHRGNPKIGVCKSSVGLRKAHLNFSIIMPFFVFHKCQETYNTCHLIVIKRRNCLHLCNGNSF